MVRDNAIIHEVSYFSFLSHKIIVDSSCSSGYIKYICVLLSMFSLSAQSVTLSLIPVIYSFFVNLQLVMLSVETPLLPVG